MAFASFNEFLSMGGHAPYVWAAWALTMLLLGGIALHARAEGRRQLQELRRRVRRERRRAAAPHARTSTVSSQEGQHHDA